MAQFYFIMTLMILQGNFLSYGQPGSGADGSGEEGPSVEDESGMGSGSGTNPSGATDSGEDESRGDASGEEESGEDESGEDGPGVDGSGVDGSGVDGSSSGEDKPEKVMLNLSDSNICEGDIIRITCSAYGQPDVHTYQLFENDTPVPDSDTAGVWNRTMSAQGSFTYRCVANNTVGTSDKNVTVTVNVPPVVHPLENITITEGESKTLTCNVSGGPALSVQWTEVTTGARSMGITRQLEHISKNESGEYKCEASNFCGNDTKSTFLIVQCLEKNLTTPKPVLPTPRPASEKETEEAVQFSIPRKSDFEWDFEKDKSFKETMASVTTDFCINNRTSCALKDARRKRRSPELYTADQVHLLPGYPSNASGSLQVAFYVQQPLGQFIGNISVLPRSTLVEIFKNNKSDIETAIGANISDVEFFFTPTTPVRAEQLESSSNVGKWAAIGVAVGVVIIILIIFIVFRWMKSKAPNLKIHHRSPGLEGGDAWGNYNFYES